LSRDLPDAWIVVAAGLDASRARPKLPARCSWLDAPNGLARALATATVAIVAGGVTLYEAAALGTPAIALPIVAAQRPAVRAFAAAGAALDATGATRPQAIVRATARAQALLASPSQASLLGRRARKLVDGHGAARVARRLLELVHTPSAEVRHAA
jgi:spore coat polysaccharide biosynthesis predicted glycosyltransferase SpsG